MADVILLGSYSKSIHSISFTKPSAPGKRDGTLTVGPSFEVGESPSWVTQHPTLEDVVYACSEDEENGTVIVAKVLDGGKGLEVVGRISSGGGAPAHIAVLSDGSALVLANYMTSSVALIPLLETGLFPPSFKPTPIVFPFSPTKSPLRNMERQDKPHPHQVVEVDVNGKKEIWVPDLGGDTVWRLEITGKGESIGWKLVDGVEIKGDEGGGPRHILVSPDAKHVYILNELLPALTHSTVSLTDSTSTLTQKIAIVPPPPAEPVNKGTKASTAELLLLDTAGPGKKTIFASTRTLNDRETDTLAQFELDEKTGEVTLVDFVYPRKGREFRAVSVSKCGKFVVVAGQEDGWVSCFGQDTQGKWVEVTEQVQLKDGKPTGVLFI